jgi:hypothetical protein
MAPSLRRLPLRLPERCSFRETHTYPCFWHVLAVRWRLLCYNTCYEKAIVTGCPDTQYA